MIIDESKKKRNYQEIDFKLILENITIRKKTNHLWKQKKQYWSLVAVAI